MKQKFLSFMLALIIISICYPSAFAIEKKENSTVNRSATFLDEVVEQTRMSLQFIEPEKSLYGLPYVDFSSLELGEQIPAYTLMENGTLLETDIIYFPILSGSEWVATSIVSFNSEGDPIVQISTAYAKAYNGDIGVEEDVALVFDDSSSYIIAESDIIKVSSSPNIILERGSLEKHMDTINIEKNGLEAMCDVGLETDGDVTPLVHPFEGQYYLPVPCIRQAKDSLQCWAACIASIRGYYGTPTTIDEVYDMAGIRKYNAAPLHDASYTLEKFGFNLNWGNDGGYSWLSLRNAIYYNETPIYCHIGYSDKAAHAIVIRGYYVNLRDTSAGLGLISYMDPVDGAYCTSVVKKDCEFYYVPSSNPTEYIIDTFLEVVN